jgi:UPF0042 nucleotide-binding protein
LKDSGGTAVVLVAGYRYAGRSLVLQRLEAAGYQCVDNLPPRLVPDYLDHARNQDAASRIAVAIDTEGNGAPADAERLLEHLDAQAAPYKLVFIEATESVLRKRKQSAEEIPGEVDDSEPSAARGALARVRSRADLVIDSSYASPLEERDRIIALAEGQAPEAETVVDIGSFGFKYGAPDGDVVVDARFIPNPYYVAALRPLCGLDPACADYVLGHESARGALSALTALASAMVPAYAAQGRGVLKLRIGCTGGQHRSVALAEALGASLRERGMTVLVGHRELAAGRYAGPASR